MSITLIPCSANFGAQFLEISAPAENNAKSIFIPPGFAHGFLGLSKENILPYICTNYRSKKHEIGLLWNDKNLKIKWPIRKPIISKKDKLNLSFKQYKKIYL